MSHTTSEAAVNAVGNRYEMILIATRRAKEIYDSDKTKAGRHANQAANPLTVAMKEIEDKKIGREYLNINKGDVRK